MPRPPMGSMSGGMKRANKFIVEAASPSPSKPPPKARRAGSIMSCRKMEALVAPRARRVASSPLLRITRTSISPVKLAQAISRMRATADINIVTGIRAAEARSCCKGRAESHALPAEFFLRISEKNWDEDWPAAHWLQPRKIHLSNASQRDNSRLRLHRTPWVEAASKGLPEPWYEYLPAIYQSPREARLSARSICPPLIDLKRKVTSMLQSSG